MKSNQISWKAVRPVRSSEEIFDVLSLLIAKKSCTIEDFRKSLMQSRETKEEMRLRVFRIRKTILNKIRKRPEFLTKAEQILRVLTRTKLITKSKDIIKPTKLAIEIIYTVNNGHTLEARTMILATLLNSKFESYHLFIKRLT